MIGPHIWIFEKKKAFILFDRQKHIFHLQVPVLKCSQQPQLAQVAAGCLALGLGLRWLRGHCHLSSRAAFQNVHQLEAEAEAEELQYGIQDSQGMSSTTVPNNCSRNGNISI